MDVITSVNEQVDCDPRILIGQLEEQCELYEQLAGLAEHQRGLIADGQTGRLLEVLAQRQKLVDRLTTLAEAFRPYQRNWRDLRSQMNDQDGTRVDELVARMNALLSGILAKDEADVQQLEDRKNATAAELSNVGRGKQAGAAYAAEAGSEPSQVDWTEQ